MTKEFYARLAKFYTSHCDKATMSIIWSTIFEQHQKALHEALMLGDPDKIEAVLEADTRNPEYGCLYGIHRPSDPTPAEERVWVESLAQEVGVIPFPNPEQPVPTAEDYGLEYLIQEVEKKIGVKLDFPIPGIAGLHAGERVIPWKLFAYAALWQNAKQWFGYIPNRVIEIGPGLGYLGYLFHQYRHVKNAFEYRYVTIDLPIGAVIHAYILAKLIGEQWIWLGGEDKPFVGCWVNVCASTAELDLFTADAAFNHDSMPEIPGETAARYFDVLVGVLPSNGPFFSFNQESTNLGQMSVKSAVEKHGAFECVSRHPTLIRPGYVEEIFVLR